MQATLASPRSLVDLQTIAQQVFALMVDMEAYPQTDQPHPLHSAIVATLAYTEPSAGTIVVECSPALAYAFTAKLMTIPLPSFCDANVQDAMCELVNMIGGNLKALMPKETSISLPQILSMEEARDLMDSRQPMSQFSLLVASAPCRISLFDQQEP